MINDSTRGRFVCPECHGTIAVDPPVRRALVEHGCVLCGTAVSQGAFEAS